MGSKKSKSSESKSINLCVDEFKQSAKQYMESINARFDKIERDISALNREVGLDKTPAIKRFEFAQECIKKDPNNAVAIYVIYMHYKYGFGDTECNEERAIEYLVRAASLGYACACRDLLMYRNRYKNEADDVQTQTFIKRALELDAANSIPQTWLESIKTFGLNKDYSANVKFLKEYMEITQELSKKRV